MLYQGFNQSEMNRITAILEKHGAQYDLSAGLGEDGKKIPRDSSVLQIEISNEELEKVSPEDRRRLEDLRIHGEMESPFDEEHFTNPEPVKKAPVAAGPTKISQYLVILGMVLMVGMYLYKKLNLH
jgi:hypothetical protein